jgi:hypothetical protein
VKLAKNDNYKLICWRVPLAHLLAKSPWRYRSDTMIPIDSRRLFGLAPCHDSEESWLYMNPNVSLHYPVPHLYSIFHGKWRLLNGPRSGLCPWQDTALVHFWCWSCVSWPCEGWIRRCHSSHQSIGIGGEEKPCRDSCVPILAHFFVYEDLPELEVIIQDEEIEKKNGCTIIYIIFALLAVFQHFYMAHYSHSWRRILDSKQLNNDQ